MYKHINEADIAVAEMLKASWEALGFKVSITKLGTSPTDVILEGEKTPTKEFVDDDYMNALKSGNFDVIIAFLNFKPKSNSATLISVNTGCFEKGFFTN